MSVYTVTVPFAGEWLTSNPRSTGDRYGRAGAVKDWRVATVLACQAAKLPKGLTVPVSIYAECFHFGRAPVRDSPNLYPTVKACVDGLGPERRFTRTVKGVVKHYMSPGYGLLIDDDDKHVTLQPWALTPTLRQPRVELTITEVAS